MAEGKIRWSDDEIGIFLEACLEELSAMTITSTCPKPQGYKNLIQKMKERIGRNLTKDQVKYIWCQCRKRWMLWTWLESKATGIGRDPITQAIVADDNWWEDKDQKKDGARVFKDSPLKHIDLHCAIFSGRTVVGNHSAVAGAAPAPPQQPTPRPNINISQLLAQQQNIATLGEFQVQEKARGQQMKLALRGDRLQRRVEVTQPSMESRSRKVEEDRARSAAACIQLVVADGHNPGSDLFFMALDVFERAYWGQWFIDYCPTPESRSHYIVQTWQKQFGGKGAGGQGGGQPGYEGGTGQQRYGVGAPPPTGQQGYGGGVPPPTCSGGHTRFGASALLISNACSLNWYLWNHTMSDGSSWSSDGTEGQYTSDEDDAIIAMMQEILAAPPRAPRRVPTQFGITWMLETMANPAQCRNNSSRESNNRWVRSNSTVSIYFRRVLSRMVMLGSKILKPIDPNFTDIPRRLLQDSRFGPFQFAVGAVDGTHIPVTVGVDSAIEHMNRHDETTKNVLTIVGFDGRVIFADAGWLGSVHDNRVLNEAIDSYPEEFPRLPFRKYLLVDSGYPSRMGFLAPYPRVRYHKDQFKGPRAPPPEGREEKFNYIHAKLRNIIERQFGIVKKQWKILKGIPYNPYKNVQSDIILAAFCLHNFRIDSKQNDFQANNPLYNGNPIAPIAPPFSNMYYAGNSAQAMKAYRDAIANSVENL
uniref:Transposon protein, putative, CACTA, En/Spm sub-class n=1 Tax=Oryza sativa subsp. japonica TaxID=39947 RepID=Q10GL5_ORYSJ|nr:transposon protein, putative, CACTA, En/Spm sub-class [Oryza sativa Japonica Group]